MSEYCTKVKGEHRKFSNHINNCSFAFYEGDASFEHFIEETLKYLKLEAPQGQRPQVDALLKAMHAPAQKILLIMDGFERVLRLYANMNAAYQSDVEQKIEDNQLDCVNLNTEIFLKSVCSLPVIKSKVMMTTRLTPRAVKPRGEFMLGCREEELKSMNQNDAIAFLRAQGVQKGTDRELENVCRFYGFHSLSLRLLAGYIVRDFKNAGNIVAAQELRVSKEIKDEQNNILEVSYFNLPSRQQKLLSTIACFRSSIKLNTLESITENKDSLENDLRDLIERGLLQFNKNNNVFDLHPIVRRYVYEHLVLPERIAVHAQLIDYFESVPKPEKVEKLEDLAPAIELYHHTVRANKLDEAIRLFDERLNKPLYYQLGAHQIFIELLSVLINEQTQMEWHQQSSILNNIANAYAVSGQPALAVSFFEQATIISQENGDEEQLSIALGNLAHMAQLRIGALRHAEHNLHRSIDLCRKIGDEFWEASGHYQLAYILSICGKWDVSEQEYEQALFIAQQLSQIQPQSSIWSNRALRLILMARANLQPKIAYLKSAIQASSKALELVNEETKLRYKHPRDHIRAYWLLGAAYRANNELDKTEENLSEAISICRKINLTDTEADILLDIARLRYDQGDFKDAQEKASEALTTTERSGYVLQGADVNLFLAQYALEQEKDKAKAKAYAEEALKLATCDGPPYYYKVAYEEAERFLARFQE